MLLSRSTLLNILKKFQLHYNTRAEKGKNKKINCFTRSLLRQEWTSDTNEVEKRIREWEKNKKDCFMFLLVVCACVCLCSVDDDDDTLETKCSNFLSLLFVVFLQTYIDKKQIRQEWNWYFSKIIYSNFVLFTTLIHPRAVNTVVRWCINSLNHLLKLKKILPTPEINACIGARSDINAQLELFFMN